MALPVTRYLFFFILGAIGLSSVCGETSGSEANLAQFIKTRKEMHGGTKLLFPCGDLRLETLRLSLAEESTSS